jgi:hypothetical protein
MRVYRSPLRLFIFGVVGLILMVAAVDVMFAHWVSTEPDNNEGVLNTRGKAQQRGDFVWGAGLMAAGTLLFGSGVIELVRRKPLVEIREDGIVAAVGTTVRDVVIPWDQIESVSSGVVQDPFDGSKREQLFVELSDVGNLPEDLISAKREGTLLSIDAHDWTTPVIEMALAAQGALDYHRRVEAINQMGEPSLVWEVTNPPVEEAERDANEEEPE